MLNVKSPFTSIKSWCQSQACKSGLDGAVGMGEPGSFSSSAVGCPCLCSSNTERGQ